MEPEVSLQCPQEPPLVLILGQIELVINIPSYLSKINFNIVRFEVFTAVTMKKAGFWDVAPCRNGVNRRFGGTYRLHLQGRREIIRKSSREASVRDGKGSLPFFHFNIVHSPTFWSS
jgi:hypothetical protein